MPSAGFSSPGSKVAAARRLHATGSRRDANSRALAAEAGVPEFFDVPLQRLSRDGVIVAVNAAYCNLLGRSRDELVGHHPREFTHPDDVVEIDAQIRAALAGSGSGLRVEKRYIRPDGSVVWVRVTGVPASDGNGVVAHFVDVSDLVMAREAARHAEERVAALVGHSANPIFVVDADGRLSQTNPASERLAAGHVGEPAVSVLAEIVHPDDLGLVLANFATSVATRGVHQPTTFRLADGAGGWLYMETIGNNQLDNPAINGIVFNARDVTDRVLHLQQTEHMLRALIDTLGRTAESRDPYTAGHQRRVAELGAAIGEEMGLDAHTVDGVALGATVHDIGKIAVPAEILTYPGKLTGPALEMVRSHCQVGHDVLAGIEFPWPIAQIVLQHHERLDGSGYPRGLRGEQILLETQVVAVADVAEAITSHRPYRSALGVDVALAVLGSGRGALFNTECVDACVRLIKRRRFAFLDRAAPDGDCSDGTLDL
jgi:PAS domain S-box-containing protein